MKVFYAGERGASLPADHRFPQAKYGLLHAGLRERYPDLMVQTVTEASLDELARVHDAAYLRAICGDDGHWTPEALRLWREIGFPATPAGVARARRSVAATVCAARTVVAARAGEARIAANLAGGTHHAGPDHGGGFCVFNDIAVAIRAVQADARQLGRPIPHVAVIDLDVHQGNGTAEIFAGDASVFTLSLHGEKNYPFRKARSCLDVGLPDACRDEPYLHALHLALAQLDSAFRPDLVFYQAGADVHEGDRLGRLKLTLEGVGQRDRVVFDWCWARRLPVVLTMGGGYGHVIGDTVCIQLQTFGIARMYACRWGAGFSAEGWQNPPHERTVY